MRGVCVELLLLPLPLMLLLLMLMLMMMLMLLLLMLLMLWLVLLALWRVYFSMLLSCCGFVSHASHAQCKSNSILTNDDTYLELIILECETCSNKLGYQIVCADSTNDPHRKQPRVEHQLISGLGFILVPRDKHFQGSLLVVAHRRSHLQKRVRLRNCR